MESPPRSFLIGLALLAPSFLVPEEISWSPPEGATIARRFRVDAVLVQGAGTMRFDDDEHEIEGGIARWRRREVRVSDELRSKGDGRPRELARTFDSLSLGTGVGEEVGEDDHHATSSSSELEDATVVFTWDADDEEYLRSFDPEGTFDPDGTFDPEGAGEEERLEGLREDMDLRGFLPRGDVEEGESWSVEPEALAALLAAGGALGLGDEPPGEAPDEGPDGAMLITIPEAPRSFSVWFTQLEGQVEATLGEAREEDGARVAVIALEFDTADFELALEGEGELWWDLERGVFHTVELESELEATLTAEWALEHGPVTIQIGVEIPYEGTLRVEATTLDGD